MKLYIHLIYLIHCVFGEAVTNLELINDENNLPKTCTVELLQNKLGYDCSNLNLEEVPQHLRPDVEALGLGSNLIRELNENSFARYTDIKYLYLYENRIQVIEVNTFSHLTSLEAIDFSTNGLTTLPMELFSLPLLRNIHAPGNPLVNLHENLKTVSKPITAPLKWINLAGCQLNKVPDFGVLPDLWLFNISSNDLFDITPQQLSPFCSLTSVDVHNTKLAPCSCQALRHYFLRRSIAASNHLSCDTSAEELLNCPDVSTVDSESFGYCMSLKKEKRMQRK